MMFINKKLTMALVIGLAVSSSAHATLLGGGVWDGWTVFADGEETSAPTGLVGPGVGGQSFDAEYLLYRLDGNTLSIGLQTGFNVVSGLTNYSGKDYWAGDLALSFDGDVLLPVANPAAMSATYEYGIDFGLFTADYNSNPVDMGANGGDPDVGEDNAGLYQVDFGGNGWNYNLVNSFENDSAPYALDDGTLVTSLVSNSAGSGLAGGVTSYYRQTSFDLGALGLGSTLDVDVHWTMSCGNDYINGGFSIVPEPVSFSLMGFGLLGLGFLRRRNKA